jgi:hypothetical protein
MSQVADQVLLVVREFLKNEQLFTALDVSNKVKETFPHARHREVRDVVRSLFHTEIVAADYASTRITVTVNNGTATAEALLYHPLADAWDLDAKYDALKRSQVSAKPMQADPVTVVSDLGTSANVSTDGTVRVQPSKKTSCFPKTNVAADPAPVTHSTSVSVPKVSARDAWTNLFSSQPSLFPRKS